MDKTEVGAEESAVLESSKGMSWGRGRGGRKTTATGEQAGDGGMGAMEEVRLREPHRA